MTPKHEADAQSIVKEMTISLCTCFFLCYTLISAISETLLSVCPDSSVRPFWGIRFIYNFLRWRSKI